MISHRDEVIDSRDVIARIEELEGEEDSLEEGDRAELDSLRDLARQAEPYADDWAHGVSLIRDSHFKMHAQEMADDCGLLKRGENWPYTCIDWDAAAEELQQDYTAVEFRGVTYWVR